MDSLHRAWEALQAEVSSACSAAAGAARLKNTSELNQLFRRLRQYESDSQWHQLICEAAATFSEQAALFTIERGGADFRCGVNMGLAAGSRVLLSEAQALAATVNSREPVIALSRASEVGEEIAAASGSPRVHLVPIANGGRVVAVLIGGGQRETDPEGLELVAQMGSAVLERSANRATHMHIAPAAVAIAKPDHRPAESKPEWSALRGKDQELHRKAQRFARLAVAKMQVTHPAACRAGRDGANLYTFLQYDIDRARESFRTQFMTIPSMVDYLHLELVEQTASGDAGRLGVEYPGQLA